MRKGGGAEDELVPIFCKKFSSFEIDDKHFDPRRLPKERKTPLFEAHYAANMSKLLKEAKEANCYFILYGPDIKPNIKPEYQAL